MQILIMIKNQLKLLFNNRIAVFATIAAPMLLTYLFSLSANSTPSLYVSDLDNSIYSKQLIVMLQNHENMNVVQLNEEELVKKINSGNANGGFIIEKNFGESLNKDGNLLIKMLENSESSDDAFMEQTILSEANALKKINIDSKTISEGLKLSNDDVTKDLLHALSGSSNISINDVSSNIHEKMLSATTSRLIGFLVMFIWFVVVQGFRTLVQEKENNTSSRILSTQVSYTKYLISKLVATYIFALIIVGITLAAGKYFFNISLAKDILSEAIIFAFYIFALTGIVMIFVPFVKKQQSFTIIGAVIMVLTGILGGSFFPVDEIASNTMKFISKLTPEAWAIKSVTDITLNNAALNAELTPLLVLATVGFLGLSISYLLINFKIRSEKA